MMEELAARVECDPDLADVTVATLAFPHQLLGASKGKYTKQTASLLYRYECEVKEGKKKKIIFPVNVGNSHWVAGVVDFTKKNQSRRFSARFFRAAQNIHQGCEKVASAPIRRSFPFRVRHTRAWRPERWIQLWDRYVQYLRASLVPDTPLWIPRSAVLARIQHFIFVIVLLISCQTGATRAKISIADLLNPHNGRSNRSSDSVAFSDS
ncbi:hypothetical protein B0H10DRAFT_2140720, partial [Mycena sp. CBHHK59/15]